MSEEQDQPGGRSGHLPGRHGIDAYGDGGFRFGDMSHRGSILVLPSGVHAWSAREGTPLTLADIAPILAEAGLIELLLFGTGALPRPLAENLRAGLRDSGLRYEVMPTPAAARTFNVLVGEGRHVAAALLAVA